MQFALATEAPVPPGGCLLRCTLGASMPLNHVLKTAVYIATWLEILKK